MNKLFEKYKQELSSLQYTPEQKQQLARASALMTERKQHQPVKPKRLKMRVVLTTIAAVIALIGTVSATGIIQSVSEIFAPIFGTTPEKAQVINQLGKAIGVSDTDNGVTISIDGIIGDPYHICFMYTVSWDNNMDISLPKDLSSMNFDAYDSYLISNGTLGKSWFLDSDPTDNKIQYYETLSCFDAQKLGTRTVNFKSLQYYDGEQHTIAEGDWQLSFDISHEDSSVHFDDDPICYTIDNNSVICDNLTVSPIGVHVEFKTEHGDGKDLFTKSQSSDKDQILCIPVIVTKIDGTIINITDTGFGGWDDVGNTEVIGKGDVFDTIIPLDEIKSVTVGNIEYPISSASLKQLNLIYQMGRKIQNASVTSHGVTISADAIAGDPYKAYIAYTISWDETVPKPQHLTFSNNGSDSIDFIDTNPSDNKMQCIQSISSMQIDDLSKFTIDAEDADIGHWQLTFDARYPDTTVKLDYDDTLTMDEDEIKVRDVNISPFGIRTVYGGFLTANGLWEKVPEDKLEDFCNIPVVVTKTDGAQINLMPSERSEIYSGSNDTTCSRAWVFEEIIPLEEIALVTVGDIEYPVAVKNPTAKQLALINEIGRTVEGVSVTNNGATLSVDAVLSDAFSTLVSYTFSWDENMKVDIPSHILNSNGTWPTAEIGSYFWFEKSDMEYDSEGSGNFGIRYFIDEDPTDNKIQIIQGMNSASELKNLKHFRVELEDFSYYQYDGQGDAVHYPLIKGTWKLKFDASCPDTSVSLSNNESFRLSDMDVTVTQLSISPLGLRWQYQTAFTLAAQADEQDKLAPARKKASILLEIPISITKTDGTVISIDRSRYGTGLGCSQLYDGGEITADNDGTYEFNEIIPLDEIQSVTLGSLVYTVPHN